MGGAGRRNGREEGIEKIEEELKKIEIGEKGIDMTMGEYIQTEWWEVVGDEMEEKKNSQREEKFKNIDGKDRKYHLGDNIGWIYTNWVMGGDGK